MRFVFKPRSEGNRDHLFLFNESPFKFVQTESILPNYKTLISNHKPSIHHKTALENITGVAIRKQHNFINVERFLYQFRVLSNYIKIFSQISRKIDYYTPSKNLVAHTGP